MSLSIRTYGNLERAQAIVDKHGKLALKALKEFMAFQNLQQMDLPAYIFPDGSSMVIQSVFGSDLISVIGTYPLIPKPIEGKVTPNVFLFLYYYDKLACFALSVDTEKKEYILEPKEPSNMTFFIPVIGTNFWTSEVPVVATDPSYTEFRIGGADSGINTDTGFPLYTGTIEGYGQSLHYYHNEVVTRGLSRGYSASGVTYGGTQDQTNWVSGQSGNDLEGYAFPAPRHPLYTRDDGTIVYGIGLRQLYKTEANEIFWDSPPTYSQSHSPVKSYPVAITWFEHPQKGVEPWWQWKYLELPYHGHTTELNGTVTETAPNLLMAFGDDSESDFMTTTVDRNAESAMVVIGEAQKVIYSVTFFAGYVDWDGFGYFDPDKNFKCGWVTTKTTYFWDIKRFPGSGTVTTTLRLGSNVLDTYVLTEDGSDDPHYIARPADTTVEEISREYRSYVGILYDGYSWSPGNAQMPPPDTPPITLVNWDGYTSTCTLKGRRYSRTMDVAHKNKSKYIILLRESVDVNESNTFITPNTRIQSSVLIYSYEIDYVIDGTLHKKALDTSWTRQAATSAATTGVTITGERVNYVSCFVDEENLIYTYVIESYDEPGNHVYMDRNWKFQKRIIGLISYGSKILVAGYSKEFTYEKDDTNFTKIFSDFELSKPSALGEYWGEKAKEVA